MRFADDVLLFASSKEQLPKMLRDFKRSTEKEGHRKHPGKTKILSNQSSNTRKELEKDNIKVEKNKRRRYKISWPNEYFPAARDDRNQESHHCYWGNIPQIQTGADIEISSA